MQINQVSAQIRPSENHADLGEVLKKAEEICRNCHPLTATTCTTDCRIWKMKNQSLRLYDKLKSSCYMNSLLNALKNRRRLQVLELISKRRLPLDRIQQELKKQGFDHSQSTIIEEYLNPLIETGLAEETLDRYGATMFGGRLSEMMNSSLSIDNVLPLHSECHEERILTLLLAQPRTYQDLRQLAPVKSLGRVLNRLHSAKLIQASENKDYIFYFRTKRDLSKEQLSPTETKIYENLSSDGLSARKLADSSGISLRRVYKYLRKLKGKKMIFTRTKPKSFALTGPGLQVARKLEEVYSLATEAFAALEQAFAGKNADGKEAVMRVARTKKAPLAFCLQS